MSFCLDLSSQKTFPQHWFFNFDSKVAHHEWLFAVLSYNIISTFTLNLIVKWLERRLASDIFPILKVSCWQDKSKLKSFSQKPLLGKLKCVVSLPSHVLLIFLQNKTIWSYSQDKDAILKQVIENLIFYWRYIIDIFSQHYDKQCFYLK